MATPKKKKIPPRPQKKQPKKTVWIKCRAKAGCEGNTAEVVWENKTGGGGVSARYRCTTCKGVFHINT